MGDGQYLSGRVAVVTGAGSGIGQATAIELAHRGARISAVTLELEEARRTVSCIRAGGGEAIALGADVSVQRQLEQAIDQTVEMWGRLDIVVANAGINGVWAPLEELTADEWDHTQAVNMRGTFLTVKLAGPHLRRQGGSVIIVSSVNGNRIFSNTGATAYACSKAAQVAFAKMIALEYARYRVRVNVICPGSIQTDIDSSTERRDLGSIKAPVEYPEGTVPLTHGQPGSPQQVADLIAFLASDASSHISGTEIYIDGTESLLQG